MGNEGVIAVEKALALLDCFRPGEELLSLSVLARLSGYHKTTVYRLMNSLERMNYVIRRDDGLYSLGPRLLYLGRLYENSFQLRALVQPALQQLATEAGESASWYVLDNQQRLCLFRAEPTVGLRETRLPGSYLPLDDTSIGKTLRYWGLNEPLFEQPPELPLFSSGMRDPHTAACCVPIFGADHQFLAALTVTGPASRLTEQQVHDVVGPVLQRVAAELTRQLGGSR
ncbi:IclR family transcriptional regulator [Tatumella citrea]|uniref:IclR family transcriptional regulator n=1 Tax=Tatumella citrea TaxID=53336 RepID=A0A1Y0LA62_TATCI|nr:IclR family transcriptional regulator [Tatumella citrea]ARU94528.1 IclR family transcriptional regulator [Tatumella citrea]ARU98566.1 IclR family transcriptional regulator [Tatumella citrea]